MEEEEERKPSKLPKMGSRAWSIRRQSRIYLNILFPVWVILSASPIFLILAELCRRGLGAVRDLRKGELILVVPKSALMTSENVMQDKKLSFAVHNHPYLSSSQVVLCYGLYTNLELLEHYGFLLQENRNDKILSLLNLLYILPVHGQNSRSIFASTGSLPSHYCLL